MQIGFPLRVTHWKKVEKFCCKTQQLGRKSEAFHREVWPVKGECLTSFLKRKFICDLGTILSFNPGHKFATLKSFFFDTMGIKFANVNAA